jgi:hypothetical protein
MTKSVGLFFLSPRFAGWICVRRQISLHEKSPGQNIAFGPGLAFFNGKNYSLIPVIVAVVVPIVIIAILGREGHTAKHFSGLCRADDFDLAETVIPIMIAVARRQSRGVETIRDLEQLVGIGALVSTGADG